ncbi:uncharacterized protein LOC106869294 [Octopus bimaculoides]|uniref:uncharacterized protein LOC106869294 n=1 Tax=Octopus bimaculoides TaxID=37653 RepID=UPI00071D0BBB|nr:uncharacterized protein LOC106869294 [Octopus bimaculoides]|eukprot:XP_014770456.1 PREDICTED: uncharacterized protein LOC106869294 [Octopus bimaculoides]
MELSKCNIQPILLFNFKKGCKAVETVHDINETFDEGMISEWSAQKCFKRFRSEDLSPEDHEHSGHPSAIEECQLKTAIEKDSHKTSQELAKKLRVYAISSQFDLPLKLWLELQMKNVVLSLLI